MRSPATHRSRDSPAAYRPPLTPVDLVVTLALLFGLASVAVGSPAAVLITLLSAALVLGRIAR